MLAAVSEEKEKWDKKGLQTLAKALDLRLIDKPWEGERSRSALDRTLADRPDALVGESWYPEDFKGELTPARISSQTRLPAHRVESPQLLSLASSTFSAPNP